MTAYQPFPPDSFFSWDAQRRQVAVGQEDQHPPAAGAGPPLAASARGLTTQRLRARVPRGRNIFSPTDPLCISLDQREDRAELA